MDRELLDTLSLAFIIGVFVSLPVMFLISGLTVRIIRMRKPDLFERLDLANIRFFYRSNREFFEGLKRAGRHLGFLYGFEWLELEDVTLRILLCILVVYVSVYIAAFIFFIVTNVMNPLIVHVN